MKGPFIHTDNNIKKYNIYFLMALIPLLIYGFYKNGIYLYANHYINFLEMFKPIILFLCGFLINILIQKILEKFFKQEEKNILDNINLLDGCILSMVVMPKISIIGFCVIYFIFEFLILYFGKKYNINNLALIKLCLLIIFIYIFKLDFLNNFENSSKYILSFKSLIFGNISGGICSTCNFVIIIAWLFLATNKLYKHEISLFMILTITILCIINFIFTQDLNKAFLPLFSYSTIFSAVFIAPHMVSSPYIKVSKIIYGILCGLLSYLLIVTTKSFISVSLAITILSIISKFIDNIVQKIPFLHKI